MSIAQQTRKGCVSVYKQKRTYPGHEDDYSQMRYAWRLRGKRGGSGDDEREGSGADVVVGPGLLDAVRGAAGEVCVGVGGVVAVGFVAAARRDIVVAVAIGV